MPGEARKEVAARPQFVHDCATLLILAAAVCGGCARNARVDSVTIVADPGRFGTIERAAAAEDSVNWWDAATEDDDACTDCFAATELARFLPAALGIPTARVRLASPSSPGGDAKTIVVGAGAARALGLPTSFTQPRPLRSHSGGVSRDGFVVRSEPLRGHRALAVEGLTRTGTLAGAYALLEHLGMRFYDLGDSNAVWPARPATIPDDLFLAGEPAFETRGFWAWEPRGNDDFFLWMARNRMNLWTAAEPRAAFLEKLGIQLTAGGHSLQSEFLDPHAAADPGRRTRFAEHPEWYALENGRRQPGIAGESGANFCTSNSAAVAEFTRGIVASLATGAMRRADVLELWPLDAGRWCTCAACEGIGNAADRWLAVTAAVRRGLDEARRDGRLARDVRIATSAYLETSAPPTHRADEALEQSGTSVTFFPYFRCYAHALGDPNCTEMNRPIAARYLGWAQGDDRPYRGAMAIGEYYNVSWTKSLPVVMPHVMANDLHDLHALGARHFMTMHAPTRLWGTWTLNHVLLSRLLWNPSANVDSLIDDFCAREYGAAGADMKRFYAKLEVATSNLLAVQHTVGSVGTGENPRLLDTRAPIFRLRHLTDAPRAGGDATDAAPSLTEIAAAMRDARTALDAAREKAAGPQVASRLAEVNARFAYGESMLAFWTALIRAAAANREGHTADLRTQMAIADSAAEKLRTVTDLVQVSASHANARDGFEASGATRVHKRLREIARAAR